MTKVLQIENYASERNIVSANPAPIAIQLEFTLFDLAEYTNVQTNHPYIHLWLKKRLFMSSMRN